MDKCIVGHTKVTASAAYGDVWRQFPSNLPPPLSIIEYWRACYLRSRGEFIPTKQSLLQRYL